MSKKIFPTLILCFICGPSLSLGQTCNDVLRINSTLNESAAIRAAEEMLRSGLENYASKPLEDLYEQALLNSDAATVEEMIYFAKLKVKLGNDVEALQIIEFIFTAYAAEMTFDDRKDLLVFKARTLKRRAEITGDETFYDLAIESVQTLLRAQPRDYNFNLLLLSLYLGLESYEEALISYDIVIRLAIENSFLKATLRNIKEKVDLLVRLGRKSETRSLILLALNRAPWSNWAYREIINLYLSQSNYSEALAYVNRWLEEDTSRVTAVTYLMKIDALIGLHRFEEAEELAIFGENTYPNYFDKFHRKYLAVTQSSSSVERMATY